MKSCGIRLGLVPGLVLAGLAATASASDLRPLSDSEMGEVSGRGSGVDGGCLGSGPRLAAVGGKGFPESFVRCADEHPNAAVL